MPVAGRAFEALFAGNFVFAAGSSGGGRNCACADCADHASGFNCVDNSSAVDDHCTAHGSGSNNDAAGTDGDAAGNEARDAAYDACRAGDGKTGGKAFDHGADFANRLVQRQRAARALAVWYMADVSRFGSTKIRNSSENGERQTFTSPDVSNRPV